MEKEELYNEAWRLWGGDMQLDILIEEMAELTQAIIKARRHGVLWSHAVLEEIADVLICLEQVETQLKAMPVDIVGELKARKLARLEERLVAAKAEVQDA